MERQGDSFFSRHWRWIAAILAAVVLIAAGVFIRIDLKPDQAPEPVAPQSVSEATPEPEPEPEPQPEQEPEPELEEPELIYPVGKLSISQKRKAYVSGEMVLEIPRLELVSPVVGGTDEASLKKGVGLFDYAQLPGPYNSNTSIAGHRDIFGKEFYYIDTITDGDMIYLTYEGKKYTYEYMETFITHDSDWEPIKSKDFACVTLQSCDPIGTSLKRIFVVGKLINIEDAQ